MPPRSGRARKDIATRRRNASPRRGRRVQQFPVLPITVISNCRREGEGMRTDFSWTHRIATVAGAPPARSWQRCGCSGSVRNGTESRRPPAAGPAPRPAVYRAQGVPRPHRAVPGAARSPSALSRRACVRSRQSIARRSGSAARTRQVTPSTETPHVGSGAAAVVVTSRRAAFARARAPVCPGSPHPRRPQAPAVPTPPATPAPQPDHARAGPRRAGRGPTRNWPPSRPSDRPKKTTGKAGQERRAVRKAVAQPSQTPGPGRTGAPRRRPRRRRQLEAEARLLRAGEGQSPRQAQGRLMNAHGH